MKKGFYLLLFISAFFGANAQYTPMANKGYVFKYTKHDSGLATPYRDTGVITWGTVRPGSLRTRPADSSVYAWSGLKWNKLAKFSDIVIPTWQQTLDATGGKTITGSNFIDGSNGTFAFDNLLAFGATADDIYFLASNKGYLRGPEWNVQHNLNVGGFGSLDKKFNYTGNIRGTFTNLSLIDKGYADSAIAANINAIPLGWELTGNSGTVDGTSFIGTTDNIPFNIRVNNQTAGRLDHLLGNAFYGHLAGNDNAFDAINNAAFGETALAFNSDGNANSAFGSQALNNNLHGSGNTAVGYRSLLGNVDGLSNTAIGTLADVADPQLNNATAIGANAYVSADNTLSFGSINGVNGATSDAKSGFGTTAATERLHVVGNFRLENGSQAANRWLKTDANGLSIWADLPAFVVPNAPITGATKTKITYDAKGLVTAGADATTTDIAEGSNLYFTEERAQDATGSMVDPTLVYNDGVPSLARAAINGDIDIPAGSNTADINAGVITDTDINANAGIEASKIADGTVSNTEFQYINSLTSNAQSQLDNLNSNKVTKGGDNDVADLYIGTNTAQALIFKTDNTERAAINTSGDVGIGISNPLFRMHIYGSGGNGAGGLIGFGDGFGSVPRVGIGEYGNTDSDQGYFRGQQGLFLGAGADGNRNLTIQADGDIILGGITQVTGAEVTMIGDADISGTLTVQGNLTAANMLASVSATLNFPSTLATAVSDLTIAVPGAAVGDMVALGVPHGSVTATVTYWAWVSAPGVVTVRCSPKATEDPASNTFKIKVFK